jgi:hypothetical protein
MAEGRAYLRSVTSVMAGDMRFVLDQMTRLARESGPSGALFRQLDLARVGALGHSLGGQAAAHACQVEPRIRACANQDGLNGNLPFQRDPNGRTMDQPFMFLGRRPGPPARAPDSVLAARQMTRAEEDSLARVRPAEQDALFAEMTGGAWRIRVHSPGVNHLSFTDLPLVQAIGDSLRTSNALQAFAADTPIRARVLRQDVAWRYCHDSQARGYRGFGVRHRGGLHSEARAQCVRGLAATWRGHGSGHEVPRTHARGRNQTQMHPRGRHDAATGAKRRNGAQKF